jgi:hypothetical protein
MASLKFHMILDYHFTYNKQGTIWTLYFIVFIFSIPIWVLKTVFFYPPIWLYVWIISAPCHKQSPFSKNILLKTFSFIWYFYFLCNSRHNWVFSKNVSWGALKICIESVELIFILMKCVSFCLYLVRTVSINTME